MTKKRFLQKNCDQTRLSLISKKTSLLLISLHYCLCLAGENMSVRINTYIKLLTYPYQLSKVKKLSLQNSNMENLFHTLCRK